MWRQILDTVLAVNLLVMILLGAYFWYTGSLIIEWRGPVETVSVDTDVVRVFTDTVQTEVDRVLGEPERGYEPYMLLAVFPGLVETDFAGVPASTGWYVIADGRLQHQIPSNALRHDSAKAISRAGYETLLRTVSARIGIDLSSEGTITEVMAAISNE